MPLYGTSVVVFLIAIIFDVRLALATWRQSAANSIGFNANHQLSRLIPGSVTIVATFHMAHQDKSGYVVHVDDSRAPVKYVYVPVFQLCVWLRHMTV